MENKKVSLNDLKNENVETEEERAARQKELDILAQREAARKSLANAEAYKKKRLAQFDADRKQRDKEMEEAKAVEQEQHMKDVYDGMEEPANTEEFFDLMQSDIMNTMQRKKAEKEFIDQVNEERRLEAEEEEEINAIVSGEDEEQDYDISEDFGNDEDHVYDTQVTLSQPPKQEEQQLKGLSEAMKDDDFDDEEDDDDLDFDLDTNDYDLDGDDKEEEKDDDDEEDDDKPEFLNYTDEEIVEKMKEGLKGKIKPFDDNKVIDLTKFTTRTNSVTVNNAVKIVQGDAVANSANWGLFNSGAPILMGEFKGQENMRLMELLNGSDKTLTPYNRNRSIYKMIYDHDESPNKPSFENWLKGITMSDNDNLFMAIYRANYNGANYISYRCPECGEVFISDDMPLDSMVKYDTIDDEKDAEEIINNVDKDAFVPNIIRKQISDEYVIDFKEPSLYNVMIEHALLDDDFIEKHFDLITYASYIDSVYLINRKNCTLDQIELLPFDKNKNIKKIVVTKIKRFKKILTNLSESQIGLIESTIEEMITKPRVDIKYILPETECPRCQAKIEEAETPAQQLLFTRHQLARLVTM